VAGSEFVFIFLGIKDRSVGLASGAWWRRGVRRHERWHDARPTNGLVEFVQVADHIGSRVPRTLKGREQPFAFVHEALEFPTRLLRALGNIGEHALAVGTHLCHHLPTLLLGKFEFLFRLARYIRAAPRCFYGRLFEQPTRLTTGFFYDLLGGLGSPVADGLGGLPRRAQHTGCLGTKQGGDARFVDGGDVDGVAGLQRLQFVLEESFALKQAGQLHRDLSQEVSHFFFSVSAARERELRRGNRGR